ncbi:EAL domain-containing protein [Paraglaciecola aestuariivivens]
MQVTEVKDSFDLDNIVPFFQPIMDLENNTVCSYECLARLLTLDQHSFLPTEFLFLVERQQSVSQLTQTVFSRSASYFRDLNLAWNINLSLADLTDADTITFLRSQLLDYPNPQRISIEITAQNALSDTLVFLRFAELCRQLKLKIVIDNVNQHSADLKTLLSLPISGVKVSAKLLEQLDENQELSDFMQQLIQEANHKSVDLIAERIERGSSLQKAKELGIRYAQGFYFSQPKASTD